MLGKRGNNNTSAPSADINSEEGLPVPSVTSGEASPDTLAENISAEDDTGTIQGSRAMQSRDYQSDTARPSRDTIQNRELSDEEFQRRMRDTQGGALMPSVPAIPDYHVCWAVGNLSTSGGSYREYMSKGYTFVDPSEVPGFVFDPVTERGSAMAGKIMHKELVLMKLPERQYQMLMQEFHHRQPQELERGIVESAKGKLAVEGSGLVDVESGTAQLGKARAIKRFE